MTLLDFFFRKSVFSILLLLAGTSLGFSATITLRPVADTSLFQDQTNNNLGGELTIPVGATDQLITNTTLLEVNRGLIKFAVAGAVPSNATITSVTLSLTVVQVPGKGPVDSIFGLRRMLRDWGEGNKRGIQFPEGASATAGEANWNVRFYPTLSWSAPGAAAPIDFTNALSTTNFVQRLGTYAFGPTSNLVADVQAWLKNPAADFGWLLRSENETTPLTNRPFCFKTKLPDKFPRRHVTRCNP